MHMHVVLYMYIYKANIAYMSAYICSSSQQPLSAYDQTTNPNSAMAFSPANLIPFALVVFLVLAAHTVDAGTGFARTLSQDKLGLGPEKLTHFHFFFHDVVTGPNPTAVKVAEAATSNQSATFFGTVVVMDDALTAGPNLTSTELVGRAQGIYAFSSQEEMSLLMAMNIVFTEGRYNGSSVAILGRNALLNEVREMPVVGGTGAFRFARGYATVQTVLDIQRTVANVEFDLYVLHY